LPQSSKNLGDFVTFFLEMWLFFWKFSKKFPCPCCLEVFFLIAKWRIRHKKIIVADHSTRLILYYYSILWGWWTGNRPREDLAKLGYRPQRKVEIFGYLTIFLQHARPSSLNLAISQFSPSKYGDFGKKIPRKNLCMKNLWRQIGDERGVTRVKVPHFSLHGYTQTSLNPVPNAHVCVYLTIHITKLQLQTTFPKPLYIWHSTCIHRDPGHWKSWYLHCLWPVR
jgi:hypothetical protein